MRFVTESNETRYEKWESETRDIINVRTISVRTITVRVRRRPSRYCGRRSRYERFVIMRGGVGCLIYCIQGITDCPVRRTRKERRGGARLTAGLRQTNVLTVTRAVVDKLVAGIASAAERVREIHADLRTTAVVDQTLVHAARLLFLVLVAGTVRSLVAHLRHRYAYTAAGLVVAAVKLGERIAFVHGFLWKSTHWSSDDQRFFVIKSNYFRAGQNKWNNNGNNDR